jgi:hypothetical protein
MSPDEVLPGTLGPDATRWRRLQWLPFAISLSLTLVTCWGLWEVHRAAGGRVTFGWVVLLVLGLSFLVLTVLSAWIVNAPWLHLRVHDGSGKRIAISLPLPLGLVEWGVRIAGRYVDAETSTYLDATSEMVRSLRATGRSQPVEIGVDEGDQRVQIYIG